MELRAVKHYASPGYPSRDILLAHPELLRLVPERWRANPLVLGVLAGTLSLLTACRQKQTPPAGPATTRVAPLFIHGEGQGSFGGLESRQFVILGEDDARALIRDEAKRAGIEFAEDVVSITGVEVPITSPNCHWRDREGHAGDRRKQRTTLKLPLTLDGADPRTGIGYEFVSEQDFNAWEDRDLPFRRSGTTYDIRETAARLRHGLAAAAPTRPLGVFYDPLASTPLPADAAALAAANSADDSDSWQQVRERHQSSIRRHAEELLRQQVRDFIAWLKAQGVI